MNTRMGRRILLAVIGSIFVAVSAQAQSFIWNSDGTGWFDDGTKWSTGVPPGDDPSHYAYFRPGGALEVSFVQNEFSGRLYVGTDADVTFQLLGRTYRMGLFGQEAGAGALTLLGGTLENTGSIGFTGAANNSFTFTIGAGATYHASGSGAHQIFGAGDNSVAVIDVVDGGRFTVAQANHSIRLGTHANGQATLSVRGALSELNSNANDMSVGGTPSGNGGTGTLELRGGGKAILGAGDGIGRLNVWQDGLVDIGAGSELDVGELRMRDQGTLRLELHQDQVGALATVTGNALLYTGALLDVALANGFVYTWNQQFALLDYGGGLHQDGVFSNWAENEIKSIGGHPFQLTYGLGSNDTILLTAIPEPGSLLLAGIGLLGLRLLRRRR